LQISIVIHVTYNFRKCNISAHGLSPMHYFVSKVNAFLRRRRRKRCAMYIDWFTTPTGTFATHLRWNLMPTIKMKTGYTAARARMATLYLLRNRPSCFKEDANFLSLSYASSYKSIVSSFQLWSFKHILFLKMSKRQELSS